ncbi:MAG: thioredoxin family protein [Pseudomonadota bacterium]
MLALALVFTPRPAISAELVMVEESFCEWCELWNEEIGVVYAKTEEGERAPLRRVEMRSAEMKAMTFKMRVQYTPTFILMEDGAEVGRIEGYPGEDFFWGMLQGLLKKLPATDAATQ